MWSGRGRELDITKQNFGLTIWLSCDIIMLQAITEEHSEKIFDLIMEILHHNVVSDKPNAFNKLLNLFVCKIIDEVDSDESEVVAFQLLETDDRYALQTRLNDLYKKGMDRFLNIIVTDYSKEEIDALTAVEDFAFIEVCDDKTFEANDKILREIVALLQGFQFRYTQKHPVVFTFYFPRSNSKPASPILCSRPTKQ